MDLGLVKDRWPPPRNTGGEERDPAVLHVSPYTLTVTGRWRVSGGEIVVWRSWWWRTARLGTREDRPFRGGRVNGNGRSYGLPDGRERLTRRIVGP